MYTGYELNNAKAAVKECQSGVLLIITELWFYAWRKKYDFDTMNVRM
jgi:hypothetical protein